MLGVLGFFLRHLILASHFHVHPCATRISVVDGSGCTLIVVGIRRWWWAHVEGGGCSWMLVGAGWWVLILFVDGWRGIVSVRCGLQWVLVDGIGCLWRLAGAGGGHLSPLVEDGRGGW